MLNAGFTVMDADAAAVALALLVAVRVAVAELVADAVKVVPVVVVDESAPPPLTVHETPEPAESLVTLALKTCACPESSVTETGEMDTETCGCCCVLDEVELPQPVSIIAAAATVDTIHVVGFIAKPPSATQIVEFLMALSSGGTVLRLIQAPVALSSNTAQIHAKTPHC
jgi:hypothetical protein